MEKWYKKELIRNLVDMHIPNGEGNLEKFDPKKYAENIKKSGATVAYIYSTNCLGLCFYPTKIGIRHQAAERDIFGETVKECRKLGLGVVGYINSWGSFVCDEHPEWSVRYHSGESMRDTQRFGNPCINNEEYIEYFTSLVHELVSNYKLDGLWVDMVGIWAPVCFCDSCKEKYGKELPETVDLSSHAFGEYMHFKGKSVADYAEKIRDAALSADPDITITLQGARVKNPLDNGLNDMRYYDIQDFLAGDFYTDRTGVNVISRMLYKLSNNLPFEFMTSRCVSLERHTMNKDINELILQSYAAMMYKGAFLFIDAIDPDGEMNSEFYDEIAVIRKNLEPYFQYVNYEEKALRDVAVYYNFYSGVSSCENGKPIDEMTGRYLYNNLRKIDTTLSSAHIDYDIVTPKNLAELGNYRTLILSNLEMLGKDEVEAIRNYVADGGTVYVSGITSLRDDYGHQYDNFMLSDVMGVDYQGYFDIKPNYLAPEDEYQHLFGKHTKKYPHMLEESFVKVTPGASGKAMAKVTLPVSDSSDHLVFSSAISDPPMVYTDHPAIYENTYGKGKVIYSAGQIETDAFAANQQLFTTLVNYLRGVSRVKITAPNCVDYTVYESENDLKINLLNHQTIYPPIPIDEIQVEIKVGDKKIKDVSDITGGKMEWTVEDGVLKVVTNLEVYKLIIAEKAI